MPKTAPRRRFWTIWKKNRGGSQHPPSRAKVKVTCHVVWGQLLPLTLRLAYTYVDAHQWEISTGTVIFALAWPVQKVLAKNICTQVPLFWRSILFREQSRKKCLGVSLTLLIPRELNICHTNGATCTKLSAPYRSQFYSMPAKTNFVRTIVHTYQCCTFPASLRTIG